MIKKWVMPTVNFTLILIVGMVLAAYAFDRKSDLKETHKLRLRIIKLENQVHKLQSQNHKLDRRIEAVIDRNY